ncbi:MAG TPA: ATP-binding protein [Candidatus Wallbacteria bacterium]|nr:ATP-binding protein [Candidatus Wallbacteria bacterium]
MAVGSHKDAFLAHQKVKKLYTDKADNSLPKLAAEILLEFVKSQRQIVSSNIAENIVIKDIEKYDREKVKEALAAVDGLCGKCNENHDNNCFVNQARRVLIAMFSGVDVKEKFNGVQSLDELLKIAEELKKESEKTGNIAETQGAEPLIKHAGANIENLEATFDTIKEIVGKLKQDYHELKEKDVFRATLIDEVVNTIKMVAAGNFSNPMPIHEDEQLGKISSAFNMMLETVDHTFKNLDAEVAKRSSELKMLMGNVKIGIFSINREFRVNREYSKECLKIFECSEIGGMNFFDLVHVYGSAHDFKENIKKFFDLYFLNSGIDSESLNALNPIAEYKWNEKYLQFTMFPVFSLTSGNGVENILIQVEDVTSNKMLQLEISQKDMEARQIRKMVLDRDAFFDFMAETSKMINSIKRFENERIGMEAVSEIYRVAHTIKGGAGCFELSAVVDLMTKFEDDLDKIIKSAKLGPNETEKVKSGIALAEKVFAETRNYSSRIFGRRSFDAGAVEFRYKKSELDKMVGEVRANCNDQTALKKSLSQFYCIPARRVFAKSFAMVAPLAQKLEKAVVLNLEGEETGLTYLFSDKLSEVMLHLLRNSIDHGIESPEERLSTGKPEEGVISVKISKDQQRFKLEVSDDGRGLDAEKIAASALDKRIITGEQAASLTEAEKLNLIFMPGFSTRSDVTTTSGRGIGMDIVKNAVEEGLGGKLIVKTRKGSGTSFLIEFPDAGISQ